MDTTMTSQVARWATMMLGSAIGLIGGWSFWIMPWAGGFHARLLEGLALGGLLVGVGRLIGSGRSSGRGYFALLLVAAGCGAAAGAVFMWWGFTWGPGWTS